MLKKSKVLFFLVLALLFSGCSLTSQTNTNYCNNSIAEQQFQDLIISTRNQVREGNILIRVEYFKKVGPFQTKVAATNGSGAVYKKQDGFYYAISNYHVFKIDESFTSYTVEITTMKDKKISAELLHFSVEDDLALIKFADSVDNLYLFNLHNRLNERLKTNEFVMAIGNPSAIEGNVTFGQYNGLTKISNVNYDVISHSALIYSGNSGGALVDMYGNLIGINTWGSNSSPMDSFAIPLTKIVEFLSSISAL